MSSKLPDFYYGDPNNKQPDPIDDQKLPPGETARIVEVVEPDEPVIRLPPSRIIPPRDVRVPVAGEGAIIPYAFGRCVISSPRVFAVAESGSNVILGLLWAHGEVSAVNAFYVGNEVFTGTVTHYLGTSGQTADSALSAAISGYSDDLADLFYSVVTLPDTDLLAASVQSFAVDFNGKLLYDPRTTSTAYSANPALMYRYLATTAGLTVDDDNIGTAADNCEDDVGGYDRWACGLVFDRPLPIDDQLALLAEYAGCFHVRDGGTVKLVPDVATATTSTFSDTQTDIDAGSGMIVANSLHLRKKSLDQIPNQVIVEYLDPSKFPWRRSYAQTATPAGDLRPTTFRMTGFRDYNTAYRFAVERLNGYTLRDLELAFETFDEGLEVEEGDVVEVTHNVGLTAKKIRVQQIRAGSDIGRWQISGDEYDPAVYSEDVSTEPTYPDITLPNPGDVPAGPSATVTEVLFTDQTGHTYTRFEVKFTGTSWPFAASYRVKVANGTDIILEQTIAHRGAGLEHIAVTSATSQDVEYTIEIWVINVFGKIGATQSSTTKTGNGKILPPTDVANLSGYEAGQFVSLDWDDAADSDLLGYEIRRLTDSLYEADPSAGWGHASAQVMASRVDASRVLLSSQPVGTYYYMVKAKDLAGNYSTNHAAVRVNVTSDYAGAQSIEELLINANELAYSRDATNAAWDHSDGSMTITYDQVGLFGVANTASKLSDTYTGGVTLQFKGHKIVEAADGIRPDWVGARFWIKKEASQNDWTEVGVDFYDSVNSGYEALTLRVDKVNGVVESLSNEGTTGVNYADLWDYQVVSSGGADWIEIVIEIPNTGIQQNSTAQFDSASAWYSPSEDSRNVAEDCIVGNLETYINIPVLGHVFGTAPAINGAGVTLTNMHVYELHGANGGLYAVTSGQEAFSDKFSAGQAFSAVYSAGETWGADENIASSFESEEWDVGSNKQGNWNWSASAETLGGTITYSTLIAKEADYPTFTSNSGRSLSTDARFLKGKAEMSAALGNGFKVKLPILASHQGKILEDSVDVSIANSASPTSFTWNESFATTPNYWFVLKGTSARIVALDSVDKDGGDAKAWDSSGADAAAEITVIGQGN